MPNIQFDKDGHPINIKFDKDGNPYSDVPSEDTNKSLLGKIAGAAGKGMDFIERNVDLNTDKMYSPPAGQVETRAKELGQAAKENWGPIVGGVGASLLAGPEAGIPLAMAMGAGGSTAGRAIQKAVTPGDKILSNPEQYAKDALVGGLGAGIGAGVGKGLTYLGRQMAGMEAQAPLELAGEKIYPDILKAGSKTNAAKEVAKVNNVIDKTTRGFTDAEMKAAEDIMENEGAQFRVGGRLSPEETRALEITQYMKGPKDTIAQLLKDRLRGGRSELTPEAIVEVSKKPTWVPSLQKELMQKHGKDLASEEAIMRSTEALGDLAARMRAPLRPNFLLEKSKYLGAGANATAQDLASLLANKLSSKEK